MGVLAVSTKGSKAKKSLLIFSLIMVGMLFFLLVSPAPQASAADEAPVAEYSYGESNGGSDGEYTGQSSGGSDQGANGESGEANDNAGAFVDDTSDQGNSGEESPAGAGGENDSSVGSYAEDNQSGSGDEEQDNGTGELVENDGTEENGNDENGIEESGTEEDETEENGTEESGTEEDDQPAENGVNEGDTGQNADQEANPENNEANALTDPYGTVYDAITKQAITNASVILEQLQEGVYIAYGNNGDGLPFNCTDGTYNFDLTYGDYKITASAEGYLSYTWSFSRTDDNDHKIDFYLASVASGITSGWCSFDNAVTIDHDIYAPGQDIEIRAPNGQGGEAEEEPFESITINEGITISTRQLGEGESDHIDGVSAGDSGDITLTAPSIHVGVNSKILAHVINPAGGTYLAGDISLDALKIADIDYLGIVMGNRDNTQTLIKIDSGAVIKGGQITLTAASDNSVVFDENSNNEDETLRDEAENLIETVIDTGLELLESFSLIGGVAISKAKAEILIASGSIITADSFKATATSVINAATSPIGLGIGVAVGIGDSTARVIIGGKIVTTGDCTIKSLADNTLQVIGSGSDVAGGIGIGVAVSVLNSESTVQAAAGSELNVGGKLTLKAETIDRNCTLATSLTGDNGKVAASVAVSYENGSTNAFLDGKATVAGDIEVLALMYKESIETGKLFKLVPTFATGVTASAGVNSSSSGDVLVDTQAAITAKATGFIKDKVKGLVSKISGQAQADTGGETSPFELAAAVSIYQDINKATARIGDPNFATTAEVKSQRNITVRSSIESQPYVMAAASVSEPPESPAPPGGGSSDDGATFAGSAAVAIGIFPNESVSLIAAGAAVDAGQTLSVIAETLNDYEFCYGINFIEELTRVYLSTADGEQTVETDDIVEVKDGHTAGGAAGNVYQYLGDDPLTMNLAFVDYTDTALWTDMGSAWQYRLNEFIRVFSTYLDDSLGLGNNVANTWIQSTAAGAKVSICGAVSILDLNSKAHAYIAEGARINQDTTASYRTGAQQVAVESNVVNEAVHLGGNITLPGISGDGVSFTLQGTKGGGGSAADQTAAGGTIMLIRYNNQSIAEIKDGVILYGDNLKVTADIKVLLIALSASGGEAGKFGLNGTLSLIKVDNTTLAHIANGAQIEIGGLMIPDADTSLLVRANDETFIINLAGGVAVSNNIGVGASSAVNEVTRDTEAVVGNLSDGDTLDEPAAGVWTINALGPVTIEALNDGFILAIGLAAAVSKEKTPDPGNTQSAPQGGGSYGVGVSAEVVLNNVKDTALAYIRLASLKSTNLVISSQNYTKVIAAGGSVAIVTKSGTSAGLAGSYTQNTITNVTRAFIDKSNLRLTGDLNIKAEAKEGIISASASGSASTSSNSGSVAGQVSVNVISSITEASIRNGSVVEAHHISLIATDKSSILAIAGAVAYGGKAGIGASAAWNEINASTVQAYIQYSDVKAGGKIKLTADSSNKILAVTAAAGASKEGMALAMSISMNTINTNTQAYIIGKKDLGIEAAEAITLDAVNNSSILAIAGGLSVSKEASIGAAGSYNEISNTVKAYIGEGNTPEQETILKALSLTMQALMNSTILSITAGGGAGGKIAINGSVSINTITNDVETYIKNSRVETTNNINLTAKDRSEIGSIAGAIGASQEAAVGAALAINYIGSFGGLDQPQRVLCYIENSRVEAKIGSISLLAQSDAIIKSISAAGGAGGRAAVYGAISLNFINTDLAAYIKDCSSPAGTPSALRKFVKASDNIKLDAIDNSAVSVIAGNVSGGGDAGIGAAIAIVFIGNGGLGVFDKYINNEEYTAEEAAEEREVSDDDYKYDDPGFTNTSKVRAYIDNSAVETAIGSLQIIATSNNAIFNITAGIAAGGKAGVQGSVSINYIHSNVGAQILNNSVVNAKGGIRIEALALQRQDIPQGALQEGADDTPVKTFDGSSAENGSCSLTSIQSLAGAIAGGGNAGVGITLAINYIANNYIASIEDSDATSEFGDIILLADCASGIQTISAALAGSGTVSAAGALALNFIHNNISAAIINSKVITNKSNDTVTDGEYPGINLKAKDTSIIQSLCGQINFAGTVGIGVAAGYNTIGNTVKAYISQASNINSRTFTTITALSQAKIVTLAVGGGGGQVSINGSVAVNSIGNDIAAYIDASKVAGDKGVIILAFDSSQIGSLAGSIGGSVYTSVGAAVAVNYIGTAGNPHKVQAYIHGSEVRSILGAIAISARSEAIIKSISAAGDGSGFVAANGAVSVNWVYTDIAAFIKDCSGETKLVQARGNISLEALERTAISVIAGNVAGAGLGGGGAAIAIIFVGSGALANGDPA